MTKRTQQDQLDHDVDQLAALDAEDYDGESIPAGTFGSLGDSIDDAMHAWKSMWMRVLMASAPAERNV